MTILVTGSEGFIGKNLIRRLKKQYGSNVKLREYDWHEGELDMPDLTDVKTICHLGAISTTTETDLDKIMRWNHDFTLKLIHLAIENNISMWTASSASVYGHRSLNGLQALEEDNKGHQEPLSFYAWSKYLIDRHIDTMMPYWKSVGAKPIASFRLFNVYGPGEEDKLKRHQSSPVTTFAHEAKVNGVIKLFEGSENFHRDFIHVDDVITKFIDWMESPISWGVYNVGTGRATSFQQIAEWIAEKYNAKIEYVPMRGSIRKHYQEWTLANTTKTESNFAYAHDYEMTNLEDYIATLD